MPLLREEAEKLSEDMMERGVIEEIIDRDELFALLPFKQVNGKSYNYNREKTISEGEFLDPYEKVPEGGATFEEVTTKIRPLAGDVDVDKFVKETMSDANDQLAIQITAKAKGLGRRLRRAIINGDSAVNRKEFDGIKKLVLPDQTISMAANGAALTFAALDELRDAVPLGGAVFMMRTGTFRAVKGLLRGMGGNTANHIQLPNFGYPIPAVDGTPVIINDFIGADEVQGTAEKTTSVYALRLNEVDGFHMLYGGASAGIRIEEIGTVQDKDAERWRVKWYVGAALKATHSIARLKGVTNI